MTVHPNTSVGDVAFWQLDSMQAVRYQHRLTSLRWRQEDIVWERRDRQVSTLLAALVVLALTFAAAAAVEVLS